MHAVIMMTSKTETT